MITPEVLLLELKLVPVVIIGVVLGRTIVRHIPQEGFELLAIAITVLASFRLIF